jgi:hypothetical protein
MANNIALLGTEWTGELTIEFKIIGMGEAGKKAIEAISKQIHFINASNMTFHPINEEDDASTKRRWKNDSAFLGCRKATFRLLKISPYFGYHRH